MEVIDVVDPAATFTTNASGEAAIPQKLRSLRNVRARPASPDSLDKPAKRQCTEGQSNDPNEAAIAEMLLGLSSSPRSSSPRDSDVSTEDEEFLPLSPTRRRAAGKASPTRRGARNAGKAKVTALEGDEECDLISQSSVSTQKGGAKAIKKLPGRCKCGKRVSPTHPPCKSELMLLCERFCQRFGRLSREGQPSRIHLNECALALGVPRRRLYDITIVFEAVEVVKRTGKLAYVWQGMGQLPALVEQLRQEEAEGMPVIDRKGSAQAGQADKQATHSLWALSRKFIRLMLTTKGPIQLSEAAEHLIGEPTSVKRQQTQITVERRLYDIGSILATLNLIQRTYIEGKRQPAFSWNWGWDSDQMVAAMAAEPKEAAPQPMLRPPPPQAPLSVLPVGALGLSVPLTWSLPPPSVIPALAQHELLQLPPLPPVLAASLLSMPPTLSGCSQDSQVDWTTLPPVLPTMLPPHLVKVEMTGHDPRQ